MTIAFSWSWTATDKDNRSLTLALDYKGEIYLLTVKDIPANGNYIAAHLSPHHAAELSEWLARAVYRLQAGAASTDHPWL